MNHFCFYQQLHWPVFSRTRRNRAARLWAKNYTLGCTRSPHHGFPEDSRLIFAKARNHSRCLSRTHIACYSNSLNTRNIVFITSAQITKISMLLILVLSNRRDMARQGCFARLHVTFAQCMFACGGRTRQAIHPARSLLYTHCSMVWTIRIMLNIYKVFRNGS